MSKKQIVLVVLIAAIVTWLLNVLIGNYLAARLSTLPFARRLNLFNPQAPIVVTNRETVRVDNSNDPVEVVESAKSKLATIVYIDENRLVTAGGAINWTSDGYFVSTATTFVTPNRVYAVVTNNGDLFPIEKVHTDSASGLVLIETGAQGLAVLDAAEFRDVRVGQQLVFLRHSLNIETAEFTTGYVQKMATDVSGRVLESDIVSGSLPVQTGGPLLAGEAVLNLSGRLLGIWDGKAVIPVNAIRLFANNFFEDNQQVVRPSYGFSYRILNETEAKALQTTSGAQVITVAPGKAAAAAGLLGGDVIVEIDGSKVNRDMDVDSVLRDAEPNQQMQFVVSRQGIVQSLIVTPTQLK